MPKRVLIIAYYWPPSGGGGVQRWLKFAKYLPEFGWNPTVCVPANADYPDVDESLLPEAEGIDTLRLPIWEPYHLYKYFKGQKAGAKVNPEFFNENPSWKQRLAIWVRGNLFIPDARRFWVRPTVKHLAQWIAKNPVDAIITTGTPHSVHLIGLALQARTGLPWLADFRDPWTTIEFYDRLRLSAWADRQHRHLEKQVMTHATHVLSASWAWAEEYEKLGAKAVSTLTNGYDEADFGAHRAAKDPRFVLCHAGTFAADRNPVALWEALAELCDDIAGFREALLIRFLGKTDIEIIHSIRQHDLGDNGEDYGYVPHHEAIEVMQSASLLLLLINQVGANAQGRIAGKVFEYMASQTPILCIAPLDGDSARIVREAGAGSVCAFGDKNALKNALREAYSAYQQGHSPTVSAAAIAPYSRRALTERLAQLLDNMR